LEVNVAILSIGSTRILVKYLVNNNGLPYYQRKVPDDLVSRLGKKLLKFKLDPQNGMPAKQVANLARTHDMLFKAYRGNPDLIIPEKKLSAILVLQEHGLRQGDGNIKLGFGENEGWDINDQPHLDYFYNFMEDLDREGKLTEVDKLAIHALKNPLPTFLSEILDIYFDNHPDGKGDDSLFRLKVKRDWDRFVELVGDCSAEQLNRDMARQYVEYRESEGKKSATVQRELNNLRAIVAVAIMEGEIKSSNPFERIRPTKKDDAKEKLSYTYQELALIRAKCLEINDDIRHLLLIQMYTGARISEIVGLRKQDCTFIQKIPCIQIKPYDKRTLKTSNSTRIVPLIPEAQEIVLRAIKESESDALFPRYNNLIDKPKADSASTYASKWLKELTQTDKTTHTFRHTLRDMFRNADITKDLQDEIHGGAKQNIADTYGEGSSVDRKLKALKKAWNPFFKFIGQPITENKNTAEEAFKRKQTGFNF
jgi:integrase